MGLVLVWIAIAAIGLVVSVRESIRAVRTLRYLRRTAEFLTLQNFALSMVERETLRGVSQAINLAVGIVALINFLDRGALSRLVMIVAPVGLTVVSLLLLTRTIVDAGIRRRTISTPDEVND